MHLFGLGVVRCGRIESAEGLKQALKSGAIKDEKSVRFLGEKSDEFRRLARKTQKKVDAKNQTELTNRLLKMRGIKVRKCRFSWLMEWYLVGDVLFFKGGVGGGCKTKPILFINQRRKN